MKLMQRLRRFARASGGLAALEFAILLPMMVFALLGAVDLIDMVGANRRAQNATSSLADVVARDTEITNDERDGFWAALNVLMYPGGATGMQMRISCVRIIDASTARVFWSEGHNGYAKRPDNSDITLPDGMMQPGASVIVAESIYPYRTPLGFLNGNSVNLTHIAYRRSRLVDPIPRVS